MAVKLRLMRMGKKKHPTYRVVAADSRSPRDGRFIELIGRYDPHHEPSVVEIDNDRANYWLGVGAQPTAAVRKLLEISGAWTRFAMARGDIHVVDASPPPPAADQAPADQVSDEAEAETSAADATVDESAGSVEPSVAEEPVAEEPSAQEALADEQADEEVENVVEEAAAQEAMPGESADDTDEQTDDITREEA